MSLTRSATPGPGLTAEARPTAPVRRRGRRFDPLPYLLVAPVAIFIVGLALIPAVFTVVQSFFKVNPLDPPTRFTGLGNFRALLADDAVIGSLGNTAFYVVVGVTLSTVLGIAMAVLLQRPFRGRSLVIAVLILPWALPGVVEGILWTGIFDPNAGLINSIVTQVGQIFGTGAGGTTLLLGQNRLLTISLIELVQVWQITPLSVLLILAALQLIPGELYEAAEIDGCTRWGAFRRITLPLARPGIAVCMVQAVIATLNVFDQPYVLNGAAATGSSITMQTYFISFQDLDFGQGYALSLMITVVTLIISLVVVRTIYRRVEL
ncbi:multiple sugar transport system permease protein [Friedmanniella endophytica]|uniref:Multiple sugar transport system permease protein n=1 Tax=Microlunatus kandeliicorticis TaxID=1759536 RepID=A0A7W3P7I4_9ACTN|nr:sugar ABC transporter permease [Microlunatus kandeliicorticis]MBA8796063.1 multiple sugar transport system permease protein [Microlunatus kandeliicorticis]